MSCIWVNQWLVSFFIVQIINENSTACNFSRLICQGMKEMQPHKTVRFALAFKTSTTMYNNHEKVFGCLKDVITCVRGYLLTLYIWLHLQHILINYVFAKLWFPHFQFLLCFLILSKKHTSLVSHWTIKFKGIRDILCIFLQCHPW